MFMMDAVLQVCRMNPARNLLLNELTFILRSTQLRVVVPSRVRARPVPALTRMGESCCAEYLSLPTILIENMHR